MIRLRSVDLAGPLWCASPSQTGLQEQTFIPVSLRRGSVRTGPPRPAQAGDPKTRARPPINCPPFPPPSPRVGFFSSHRSASHPRPPSIPSLTPPPPPLKALGPA